MKSTITRPYYKSSIHEKLFNQFVRKMNTVDLEYILFAYVSSAIEKESVLEALNNQEIDCGVLFNISDGWSHSEKAMLEASFQLLNGANFYTDENNQVIKFQNIDSVLGSLDGENLKVVLSAIERKYLF